MKRYFLRGICKSRVYTFEMAARIVGVSHATFRKFPSEGLRVINDKRPHLVRGADLIEFLTKRMDANRPIMVEGQYYCMTCRASRDARAGTVSFTQHTAMTGRLSAICDECSGKIGQFCSVSKWKQISEK